MSTNTLFVRALFICTYLLSTSWLSAQVQVRLEAEVISVQWDYRIGDNNGPDISMTWNGTVTWQNISRSLTAGCFHEGNVNSVDFRNYNVPVSLINETFTIPSDNSNSALDLCSEPVFSINLDCWENDSGGNCDFNNGDDDREQGTFNLSTSASASSGNWTTTSLRLRPGDVSNTWMYIVNVRYRYVLVNEPITSLSYNVANVVCAGTNVDLTVGLNSGYQGGHFFYQRRLRTSKW